MDYLKIFDVVVELSITGSILAVLILLVRQILKKNISKNIIYYMWVILLVKLLVPFAPESNLSLYNLFDNGSSSIISNNNTNNLSNNNLDINSNPIISQTNENSNSNILTNDKLDNNNSTTDKSEANEKKARISIKGIAFYIWIIGIFTLLGYTLLNYSKFKRNTLKNNEDNILSEDIKVILNESLVKLSIKRNIEVIISKNINSPTFYGITIPKIVLPLKVVENSSSEELKYILMHELCHYKRKDIVMAWVITLVKIIYWFNPILIIALNIMRKDCETSCDEIVLNYLEKNENVKYGNTILNVVQYVNEEKYVAGTTSMVNNKKDLKERITNIAKNKKIGIKTIIGGVLVIIVIGGIGLTNKMSSKTISLSINSDKVTSVSLRAMPSPPKEKIVYKKEDVEKIAKYINKMKLKQKGQEDIKGWEFSITIQGEEPHSIYILGKNLDIDGVEYTIDKDEVLKLRELYDSLNYEETSSFIDKSKKDKEVVYEEFGEKIIADGYKIMMDSGMGSPIILPLDFEEVVNGEKIGELLRDRNIESTKNGYNMERYLGKEAYINAFTIETEDNSVRQQVIGITCENKLIGYWLSHPSSYSSYEKVNGDALRIILALKYDRPVGELSYESVKKALISKRFKVEEVSSAGKYVNSGYSAQVHNVKINNEDVIIYEYIDGKASQSDSTLINEGMQAYYGELVMDLQSIRNSKNVYLKDKIICIYNGDSEDVEKGLEILLDEPINKLSYNNLEILDNQNILIYPAEWDKYRTPTAVVVDDKTYTIYEKNIVINKNIALVKFENVGNTINSFDSDEILVKWSDKHNKDKEFNTSIKREDVIRTQSVRGQEFSKISSDKVYPTIETSETNKVEIGREVYKKYLEIHSTDWFFNLQNGIMAKSSTVLLESKINSVDLSKEGKNIFTVAISYDVHAADESSPWFAGNGEIGVGNWIRNKFCFVDIEKIGENKYRMISSYTG